MIDDFYTKPFPVIPIDNHLFLREHVRTDSQIFFDYFNDPEVFRHVLASRPKSLEESEGEITYCKNLFKNKQGIYWAIAHQPNGRMIGTVGLHINSDHDWAEICYDLSRPYWNQGIMTKVLRSVTEFSFNHIGLTRLEAILLQENQSSIRILEKVGFEYEQHIQNYRFHQGKFYGVDIFVMTDRNR
jgi:ribosomal-protein-alanine N-acetyltransferase